MALTAIEKGAVPPDFSALPVGADADSARAGRGDGRQPHAPGEAIVKQGELGDRLFVLYDGHAEARREGPDMRDDAGVDGVGSGLRRDGAVRLGASVRDGGGNPTCQTLMLDGPTFHRLGVKYPDILWEVCRVLSQRLRTDGADAERAAAFSGWAGGVEAARDTAPKVGLDACRGWGDRSVLAVPPSLPTVLGTLPGAVRVRHAPSSPLCADLPARR